MFSVRILPGPAAWLQSNACAILLEEIRSLDKEDFNDDDAVNAMVYRL
jgi:hypothetical protein